MDVNDVFHSDATIQRRMGGATRSSGTKWCRGMWLVLVCWLCLGIPAFAGQDGAAQDNTASASRESNVPLLQLTTEEDAWRRQHPVVDVGVYSGDHLPAETWVAGRPEGFGVDYARLLAGKVGLRLSFHPYSDTHVISADRSGNPFDLLTAMSTLQAGNAGFEMLKPYGSGPLILVGRKGDERVRSESDLEHVRIAVERDFRRVADVLARRFPEATFVFADDGRQALNLVAAGKADAYVGITSSRTQMLLLERSDDDLVTLGPLDLPQISIGLAVPPGRAMLLRLLRKAEAAVTIEELARLRMRWGLSIDNDSHPLPREPTTSERDWLRSLPPLRMGYETDRYPYTFRDSRGQFNGLAADYVEILQKQLALRVELVPARDWSELERMVHAGEIDMLAAAMPDDFGEQHMVFSRSYEHFPTVIVARMHGPTPLGPEDLAGRKVAVRDEAGLLSHLRALSPGAHWLSVGSNEEGLATVASGRADAFVGTLPALDTLIRDRYAATLRVVGPAGVDQDFTVGIVNRYDRLAPMVNRVFASVKDSERQAIRSRWLTAQYHYGVPWRWVLAGLAVALLVVGVVGVSYLRQRRAMRARRVAEHALAAQLKFQQALLESIPYPVFVKDEQGRYLAVNRAYEDMFGCSRDALLGRTIAETRHAVGLDGVALHEADMQVMAHDQGGHRELYIGPGTEGGAAHDALLWRHTFERGTGLGKGLLGTLVDVTDLRRAEARALASEQQLIDTNESLPGVVMRVRYAPDGLSSFDYVGGQTVALFGLTHDDLLQGRRRPFDIMVEEDKPRVREAIQRVRDGQGGHSTEYRAVTPSGPRWVRSSFGPPRKEANGVVSCSVFCIDVTTEKAQAQALIEAKGAAEAAVAAKSAFLAMMSHEIRTPMAGVLSLVELLGKTSLEDEQSHMLDMVHDSAEALLQILDDILDFSRIEAGRLQLNEHAFDLRLMTDGVLGLFASLAREKGVRLYASLDWRLAAEYRGDMTRVRQVITNLLSNALKFTAKGRVELHMELLEDTRQGHRLAITVTDTGIGMSQEQLDRLFQPFVQAEASTSRRYGGTGLGLTICRRLAHMMGGEIRLTSTPGFGTQASFEVRFPVERILAPQPALGGKRALLCTGDILLERELSNTLSALGMSIVGADAKDLDEGDAEGIDIYVVDLELAGRAKLSPGARVVRLLDVPDPRGFFVERGEVMLGGQPLLWRSAIDACHVALGLPPPPHALAEAQGPLRHAARILVAEDHPINRAVISRQLERLGYPHTIVENGQEALRALATARYDLLVTDCHMPILDGYTLAQRIRENELGSDAHLPIVALSASALPEEVSRCREAGMDEFLAKPVQLAELSAMLSACLANKGREAPAVDVHGQADGTHRWQLLLETFGSPARVHDVLLSLIEATREDLVALDQAFQRGDKEQQRELLHRIRGALRLLGEGAPDETGDHLQQRSELVRYLGELEALLDLAKHPIEGGPAG